jgi:hypothetical protein
MNCGHLSTTLFEHIRALVAAVLGRAGLAVPEVRGPQAVPADAARAQAVPADRVDLLDQEANGLSGLVDPSKHLLSTIGALSGIAAGPCGKCPTICWQLTTRMQPRRCAVSAFSPLRRTWKSVVRRVGSVPSRFHHCDGLGSPSYDLGVASDLGHDGGVGIRRRNLELFSKTHSKCISSNDLSALTRPWRVSIITAWLDEGVHG